LEQFDVNHEEGSSHGDGRIIRFSYPETIYTEMSKIAYPMWNDIEKRHGSKLFQITGGITFGPEDDRDLKLLIDNLTRQQLPFEVLTAEETNKRFPIYRIPSGNKVVYQKDSGVAFASKAVKALWELASKQGALMLSNQKVIAARVISENRVKVTTLLRDGFLGKKLVITAGAWTNDILRDLHLDVPLKVTQEQVFYWKEKQVNLNHHMDRMPVFIVHAPEGEPLFYGLPQIDIPGVKIGWHHSGTEIDIKNKKSSPNDDKKREKVVSDFVKKVFPELVHETPVHMLHCLYTTTPDGHFILDYHPLHKNVIIGSPCSGHGFKFGPAIGSLLASMALDEKLPISLDQFKISRFSTRINKRTGV